MRLDLTRLKNVKGVMRLFHFWGLRGVKDMMRVQRTGECVGIGMGEGVEEEEIESSGLSEERSLFYAP